MKLATASTAPRKSPNAREPLKRKEMPEENPLTKKKTESEYRAQQKRGSNARCLHDFQRCSEHCCTTRSRRPNNYQIQYALHQLNTNNKQEEPNRDGIQLCVKTLQITMTTTQAVKRWRFAGPKVSLQKKKNAVERPFYGRDSCDEKHRKTHKNTNNHKQLSSDS